ncbi:hypothetical protein LTR53_003492 [Teratosphaeriaceae sp. CCFEE 6253]|nr:hypothetical protein LTR53_003492 [Teratosphaeriaceae sp. CCFEE 6253]
MRSTIFCEDVRPSSRRGTLVEAVLRPRKSLLNLLGRHGSAQPTVKADGRMSLSTDGSDVQSVSTIRAIIDQYLDDPRESVEGTVVGSSIYSDQTGYSDQTESDGDTIRARDPRNTDRRTSNAASSSAQSAENPPPRALRRMGDNWRESPGNLRRTALLHSLRDVETPGQTAEEALALLNGGASSSTASSAGARRRFAVAESATTPAEQKRRGLSALSMSNLVSRLAPRRYPRCTAPASLDEAISPKSGVSGDAAFDPTTAEMFIRECQGIADPTAFEDLADPVDAHEAEESAIHPAFRKDSTIKGSIHWGKASDGCYERSRQRAQTMIPEIEADMAMRVRKAELDATTARSRSNSTVLCDTAFDPQWRPDDPRKYSRRHRLSSLYGSEAVDQWQVVKTSGQEQEKCTCMKAARASDRISSSPFPA